MSHITPRLISHDIRHQRGFTLIELMISLVLGLLISAAVIQVFITSQRVDRIQTAGSEIQDKAVFGLQTIEPQIRLANLGNDGVAINDTTAMGGVILTVGKEDATNVNAAVKNGDTSGNFVTRTVATSPATLSNTDIPSEQLTIQYVNTTGKELFDCEGVNIEPNAHVITRYFVTTGTGTGNGTRRNLNLNCDAGRIKDKTAENFTDNGQTIIENIDQFNIRLGVQQSVVTASGKVSYEYADMTVAQYMALTDPKPPIVNIRIAVLARSTANSPEASAEKFIIFGEEQTLKTQGNAPKYLRRVYESNILLRNARVMRIIDNSAP
ncbi:PilW family protein [Psychrobacter urativorans]|uniref:Pilus assembly protein PilW n=1 Tax=Psychrobacter urativorans TaxID=45610 RepID=A0A0M4T2R9_9GAMM|nr:PilW family protein [Psychrobacter urativorans]ALF59952.1 hypothetical protein AOC03_07785 [Psychrobacter urativorans]